MTLQNSHALGGAVHLFRGPFEPQFQDVKAAQAAARDARAVALVVHLQQDATGGLAVGRCHLPFPGDERDRCATRFHMVATHHGNDPAAEEALRCLRDRKRS